MSRPTPHTPGPWQQKAGFGERYIMSGGSSPKHICTLNAEHDTAIQTANARLIAAAPDLLAALKDCVDIVGTWGEDGEPEWLEQAQAAIAKAEGR